MISLLKNIFEAISFIPQYFLFALETIFNLLMEAIQGLFEIAVSLIPLPSIPSVPEYISAINWFFPVGAIISVGTPVVAGYVTFLFIRWVYQKSGNL